MGYATVTNKIAQMRPARFPKGIPRVVWQREEVPGQVCVRRLKEGGDQHFGPTTIVRVSQIDATHTKVTVSTSNVFCSACWASGGFTVLSGKGGENSTISYRVPNADPKASERLALGLVRRFSDGDGRARSFRWIRRSVA